MCQRSRVYGVYGKSIGHVPGTDANYRVRNAEPQVRQNGQSFDGCEREEKTMTSIMSEIIFEVIEDEIDGGYSANALGYGIHTEGETLEELRRNVKEAVECYFDETMIRPGLIRLHFVRDEVLAL